MKRGLLCTVSQYGDDECVNHSNRLIQGKGIAYFAAHKAGLLEDSENCSKAPRNDVFNRFWDTFIECMEKELIEKKHVILAYYDGEEMLPEDMVKGKESNFNNPEEIYSQLQCPYCGQKDYHFRIIQSEECLDTRTGESMGVSKTTLYKCRHCDSVMQSVTIAGNRLP